MKGRSRMFVTSDAPRTEVVSIAFHDNCDLIVAVAAITPAKDAAEAAVIEFLNSERVRQRTVVGGEDFILPAPSAPRKS
jgi:hypothetical protein